jgi:hypothetical protein
MADKSHMFVVNEFIPLMEIVEESRRKCLVHLQELIAKDLSHDLRLAPTIKYLFLFIYERQDTQLSLLRRDRVWDAQILARPVLEAVTKLLFITIAPKLERDIRIREYWEDLSEVNAIKQSETAKMLIHTSATESARLPFYRIVLSESEEAVLRSKWSKKYRQQLENKWSYMEMTRWLDSNLKADFSKTLSPLAHYYRMSSHLLHADESGIGIVAERAQRNTEDRKMAIRAHLAMHISDAIIHLFMASFGALEAAGSSKDFLTKSYKEISPTLDELQSRAEPLWDTPFYKG